MNTISNSTFLALVAVLFAGTFSSLQAAAPEHPGANAHAWHSLSDAKAWRGWESADFPQGWHLDHGTLSKEGPVDDLITREQYANFELKLEWKIGSAGNSGIFYRGTREYDHIYWSGPEYQLLDDANASDGKSRLTAAAAAYALYGPPAGIVKPADQWNTTRLIVIGNHVEHWLNGKKVVEYELSSPDWKARVAASKFKAYPNYGLAPKGYIGIQGDHPGTLSIRHIRIRELTPAQAGAQ